MTDDPDELERLRELMDARQAADRATERAQCPYASHSMHARARQLEALFVGLLAAWRKAHPEVS